MDRRMVVLLSLLGGLALLALALLLLAPLAPTAVDLTGVNKLLVVEPKYLRPEPLERFLYIAGVLLSPLCLGTAYLGVRRALRGSAGRRFAERLAPPAAWALAPLLLVLLFAAGRADDQGTVSHFVPGGWIALAAAVALAAGAQAAAAGRFSEQARRIVRFALPGLAGTLLAGVLLFNLLGPEHFRNLPRFWISFNAVFYSVVQVCFGKELLVDFVNQYGLYPHFLEPLFSVVGLSVWSFTAVMGLLNCVAFGLFYRFLAKETGDGFLAFLGLTTILFFGYAAGREVNQDLFLQYHPLRTIFPALSLAAVSAFAHAPTLRRGLLLPALGAAACLWNFDSGLVLLAAGFLLIGYDALLRRRPRELPQRLGLGAAVAALVIAAFTGFLRVRFGAFPDYAGHLLHAKAFYLYGAMMLPMPRFGLWIPVLLVYAGGLLLSLIALVEGEETPRARIFFFLSVLGLGLFSYYQGRSSLGNLAMASYPAVLVVVLLAHDLALRTAQRTQAADRVLSFTLTALLLYSATSLAAVAPDFARGIAEKIRITRSGKADVVLNDARFLRAWVKPGQPVVLLSYNSGLFHLLTRTTNPLDIPSDSELVYRADFDKQWSAAIDKRNTVVIDATTIFPDYIRDVGRIRPVFYKNPQGNLVVFPATDAAPGSKAQAR
jgi:hypothetical protein